MRENLISEQPFFVGDLHRIAWFPKNACLGNLVALIESFTSDVCMLDLVGYLCRTSFRKFEFQLTSRFGLLSVKM